MSSMAYENLKGEKDNQKMEIDETKFEDNFKLKVSRPIKSSQLFELWNINPYQIILKIFPQSDTDKAKLSEVLISIN